MTRAAFVGRNPATIDAVYGKGRRETLSELVDLPPYVVGPDDFDSHADVLRDVEVIFSTWGMFPFEERHFAHTPNLNAVFYAAGSVRGFAAPFLERGITVMSAWAANAIPVAEFTLSQILLSCNGYFRNVREFHEQNWRDAAPPFSGRGVYGERIALIGAGMVARHLLDLLRPFHLEIVVYDPFLPDEEAARLGVKKVELAEAFQTAYVVSNHVPHLPETVGMFNKALFESMRPDATFINTGRGAQVVEADLMEVLRQRTDLTALLDVTHPEPPPVDSPLWNLPNVHLSSHIAGSIGDETLRMADYCIEAFREWKAGAPLKYAVTLAMLEKMA
jgi:phosphoglycerate dehydrogenase-like enzyme